MVHTLPDYTTKYKMTTIFGQIDTGELAARLGSPVTFDRRGHILFYDDFEDLLGKWNTGTHGDGASVAISTAAAATKSSSVKLTTGSTGQFMARMFIYRALPVLGKLGFEVSFTFDDDMDNIVLHATIRSGVSIFSPRIELDHTNNKIEYYDSGGIYQDLITSVSWQHETYNWAALKFVVDYTNEKYTRLIFRDTQTPMSSYAMRRTELGGNEQRVDFGITATGTTGNNAVLYVDNVIITQNEP